MEEQKPHDAKQMLFIEKTNHNLQHQLSQLETKNEEHQEVFQTMNRSHDYLLNQHENLSREINSLKMEIEEAALQHMFALQEVEIRLKCAI